MRKWPVACNCQTDRPFYDYQGMFLHSEEHTAMEFLSDLMPYLLIVLRWQNIAAMILGVLVGLFVGAIPGLNPPMAIALLIPITFYTPPETSLIILVSVYAAGIYGGSFSAILLRTPGTSASAATAIEGWELTIRGRAIEAIRISTFASVVGGTLSGIVLLTLAPATAKIALWFQPSEYFLIALLGLCSIASVSFNAISKGLIAGFFGVLISTIGIDLKSGFPRFTFGFDGLLGGIDIMPAIIGLFAITQAFEILKEDVTKTVVKEGKKGKISWEIIPKIDEILKLKWVFLRSWSIGLVIGIIPAAGASIAQWIAYGEEIRRAKPGDQFGKGEIKGLAACEGANNASTGTSFIPMFVLGIPGGISAAIILGALMIHGLNPGARLFTETPHIIYPIMWGFLLANLIMGFFAVFIARSMAYITNFPRGILAPLIMIFSVAGVYTASGSVNQVWYSLLFGIMGYFMNKYRFSTAAMLLGIVLGPICENGFRDWLIVSRGKPIAYMLNRPLSVVILILIAFTLFFAIRNRKKQKTNQNAASHTALKENAVT